MLSQSISSPRCSSARGINSESAVVAWGWNSCLHDVLQLVSQPYVSLKHLLPRCFSVCGANCAIVCLSCLWSQLWVCESFSVMLTTVCVEKVETKCVSLKHLPQRCCSACGANCESALLLMLCWQPSASKRWKQKIHLLFLYWCFQQCGKLRLTKPSAVRVLSWDNFAGSRAGQNSQCEQQEIFMSMLLGCLAGVIL